jgi:hypothetical protein
MSKGGGTQTSTTSVDPDIKKAYLENYQQAQGVAAALPQQQFAPMNAMYQSGEQALTNAALAGQGLSSVDLAAQQTGAAGAYQPTMIQGAQANLGMGQDPGTIGSYMNPYSQYVTQNAMADLETARQNAIRQTSQQAQAARAFGGSRQGVAEAQTNIGYGTQAGKLSTQLNEQAFNQAMQAQQADLARQQQAALANQSTGLAGAQYRLGAAGQLGNLGAQQQALRLGGAQAVMGAGGARQQLEQQQLDAMRNLATQRLGIQQTALGMQPGNLGQTTSTPLYQNRAAGGLGGALAGAQLANYLSPGNAGAGAALGGLLGFFG